MGPQTSVSHFDFAACCLELISDDCSCAELHTGDGEVNWRLKSRCGNTCQPKPAQGVASSRRHRCFQLRQRSGELGHPENILRAAQSWHRTVLRR